MEDRPEALRHIACKAADGRHVLIVWRERTLQHVAEFVATAGGTVVPYCLLIEPERDATSKPSVDLREAVAARDKFISAVGHEMRNALAPLLLLVEAFETGSSSEPPDRRIVMLHRNLQRLLGVVNQVSDVAQLRDEKLVLKVEEVALDAVIVEAIAEVARDAHAAHIEVRNLAPANLVARGDRLRLKQILHQLLSNAVRHSGGRVVDVSVTIGEQVDVAITDDGRGIEASQRASLFEFFERSRPNQNGGFGVGLWIVKTLCNRMGGTVAFVERAEPGCCFRVSLPR